MKIIYWLRLTGLTAIRRFDGLGTGNFRIGFGTALNQKSDNKKIHQNHSVCFLVGTTSGHANGSGAPDEYPPER